MKINFQSRILRTAICAIYILLGACSNAPAETPQVFTPTPAVDVPVVEPTPLAEIKATRPWRIAFIPKFKLLGETGKLSAYWQPAWEGAQKAGLDFGVNVELVASNVLGSAEAEYVEPQIRLVAGLIARGDIDGLVIAPFDSNRLAPVVNKAIDAGIPTIVIDTPLNTDKALTFIAYDNFSAGRTMGAWVVQQLDGKGKALILDGPQDQLNAVERRKGFLAGLKTGNIDVLHTESADWEIEPARQITVDWLQEYADDDVIIAANDNMAIGAAQAVAEAKRQGILITGFDANAVALKAIKDGQISATIDLAPGELMRLSIQLMIRHLETGETFTSIFSFSKTPLVTKENVDVYLSQRGLK